MIHTRSSRRRLAIAAIAVFAIVGLFITRLVDIQIVRADELGEAAASQQVRTSVTWGVRGNIVDANGVVLADSVERYDITASPRNAVPEGFTRVDKKTDARTTVLPLDAVKEIAAVTGDDPAALYAALTKDPTSDFAYLVKKVKLSVFEKVKKLGIPWLYSEPHPARTYPNGAIAGNLVGFSGTDGPQAGTELAWNKCLSGSNGSATYEVSEDYVRIPGSTVVSTQAKDGGAVKLTIDSDLQWFAQQALAQQGTAIGADWATAMVVRIKDGHVMVAADWPSVDPNDVNLVDGDSRGSRIFTFPYEPGSIMKPATFASLLDAGVIRADTKITVPSFYTNGLPAGVKIGDAVAHGNVNWTAAGVLMNSSNIGTAMLSERLDKQARHDYLLKFGFGTETGVGFLGEEGGSVLPMDQLDSISAVTQQFGQGISVTSAQMAQLYQTIGNHGVRVPLTLYAGCEHADGTMTDVPAAEPTRVVSDYAADTTMSMMENVAKIGPLSSVVSVPGYRIAAKTGTAEVPENGRYGGQRIVSMANIFPVDDPQYAIVVTFGKPDTIKLSSAAAPTLAAITKQVIKTFRVLPSTKPSPDVPVVW